MHLARLEADRLRNLKAVFLDLPAGVTLLAGRNGQGKSSILEAVYLLGTGRSFRTRRHEDLISWDGGPLRVAGEVDARVGPSKLTVVMDGERRSLLVDGHEQGLEGFIGRLDVVDLTGARMDVLRGAPVERRRFLDRGVVGLDPSFLRVLGDYRRALQQRNALLRRQPSGKELDVWDERLLSAANELHCRRREYALMVASQMGKAGRVLFPGGEELHVHYKPSPAESGKSAPDRFEEVYREALKRGRERDRGLGYTSLGPHRDTLAVNLGKIDLLRFGSAGQVRASMIALKLGKLSLLRKVRGDAPMFLMDDFDTDLDQIRMAALADFLSTEGFQALVASSKESLTQSLDVPLMQVRVDDGAVQAI